MDDLKEDFSREYWPNMKTGLQLRAGGGKLDSKNTSKVGLRKLGTNGSF
jgi:hypothetical protein